MYLKIFFFAELRERMNREYIESEFKGVNNIRELQEKLEENSGENWTTQRIIKIQIPRYFHQK